MASPEASTPLLPEASRLRRVLVVGAGIAGLQVARRFAQMGVECCVLEATDTIGGVWAANYAGFGLQVPWRLYQFADFPWPQSLQPPDEFPTGAQVQAYILAYAQHFGLLRLVRFNSRLLRLRWHSDQRQWEALYSNTETEKFYKVTADYVVMCNGIYSKPYIPEYQGAESFVGTQLHAKYFTDVLSVKGRRVVIVGAGKTALDCVSGLVSANTAASVTMLYRKSHWPVPRSLLGISIRRLVFNRAFAGMLPNYYTAGKLERARAAVTKPMRRLFWKSLECLISTKYPATTGRLKPAVSLPKDLFYGGQILDDRLDQMLEGKGVDLLQGEIKAFVRNGVILLDNSFLPADVVLYCTGYEKTYDYFDGEMRSRLGLQKDGLYLYRNCIPPDVPHLAFVGSEVSTYNNILSGGLQALWLAHVLTGRVTLPPPHAMHEDVRAQQRWRREVMPTQRCRGSVLMVYMGYYHDQLMADMGHSPRRKGVNVVAECFGVYSAADYKQVMEASDGRLVQTLAEQWSSVAEQTRLHGPPLTASVAASAAGTEPARRHTIANGMEAREAARLGALLRAATCSERPSAASTPQHASSLGRRTTPSPAAEADWRSTTGGFPRQQRNTLYTRRSTGTPISDGISASGVAAGILMEGGGEGSLASTAVGGAGPAEARRTSRKSVMVPHPLPESSEVLYWQGSPGGAAEHAQQQQEVATGQQAFVEDLPAQQHQPLPYPQHLLQHQLSQPHPLSHMHPREQPPRHTVSGTQGGASAYSSFGGGATDGGLLPRQPPVARMYRHSSAASAHSWASRGGGGGGGGGATASPPMTAAMERGLVSMTADSSAMLSCSHAGPDGASVGWTDAAGGSMHGGAGRIGTGSGMLPQGSGTPPGGCGDGEVAEACGIRVVAFAQASGAASVSGAQSMTGSAGGGGRIAPLLAAAVGNTEGGAAALAQQEACGDDAAFQPAVTAAALPSASSAMLSSPGTSSSGLGSSVVLQLARALASLQQLPMQQRQLLQRQQTTQELMAVPTGIYTSPLSIDAEQHQHQQELSDASSAADIAAAIAATTAMHRQQSQSSGPVCSTCGSPSAPASHSRQACNEPHHTQLIRHGSDLAATLAAAAIAEALRQSGTCGAAMVPQQQLPASAPVPRPLQESVQRRESPLPVSAPSSSVQAGSRAGGGPHGLASMSAGGMTTESELLPVASATAVAVEQGGKLLLHRECAQAEEEACWGACASVAAARS